MNWTEAKEMIDATRPRKCRLVDGILKGGFIDNESEKGKAFSMAIEAIESMPEYERLKERDRAKKPEVGSEMGHFICPSCESAITYTDEKETHKFCLKCGQRLDWSEEERSSE